jgi:hypothetical protein
MWGLGKKGSCQLHGEPMQSVTLACRMGCRVRPSVSGGDIFNGGESQARNEVARIWNTRFGTPSTTAAAEAKYLPVIRELVTRLKNIETAMGNAAEGAGMPEFEIFLHNEAYKD